MTTKVLIVRQFSTYSFLKNTFKPAKMKLKSKSSQDWLIRQMKDPYVEKAKMENYRCRSAFKLLEMDDTYKFLHPGMCVIDCGAAPGSWSQVAVARVNSDAKDATRTKGTVVSVDLLPIYPIPGAIVLGSCDITSVQSQGRIKEVIKGLEVDFILSDMAPNASGVKSIDNENILQLVFSVARFGFGVCKVGSGFLAKLWSNDGVPGLVSQLERFYSNVSIVKPKASRAHSAEIYILARDFSGVQKKS